LDSKRKLLFWSSSFSKHMSPSLTNLYDRVIEVPENIDSTNVDKLASKMKQLLFDEIAIAKKEGSGIRITQLTTSTFQNVLDNVLFSLVDKSEEIQISVLQKESLAANPINIELDHHTPHRLLTGRLRVDFEKPPLPDKPLFED